MRWIILAAFLLAASPARSDFKSNACLVDALAHLPKIAGIKVIQKSARYDHAFASFTFHIADIVIELDGMRLGYRFGCRVGPDGQMNIMKRQIVQTR